MPTIVSLINMKGGVGKSTLTFNLAWRAAWREAIRVLVVDLDPQANLSQYFLGAQEYLKLLKSGKATIVKNCYRGRVSTFDIRNNTALSSWVNKDTGFRIKYGMTKLF